MRRIVPLLIAGLLLVGCGEDSKKTPTDPEPDDGWLRPTSVASAMEILKRAHEEKNHSKYAELLHADFTYVFDPADVGQGDIPESWGLVDDLLSAQYMFGGEANHDGYRAEEIRLVFVVGDPQEDPPLNPDWTKVTLSSVYLTIDARQATNGDVLFYEVSGDQADLYLVQTDEIDPASDLNLWKIIRWEDRPIGLAAQFVQSSTWGQIKASWR